ncbi:hypothetical protein B0H19DRAFT_1076016 [Mycena capillaripes]|nr:hypothetical protein B0H19DRAFT_1076016 [Mycena capillaripes]
MAYNPDDPDKSSPLVLYLVKAVGPPPQDLLDSACEYGFRHTLQIFTGEKTRGPARVGQYSVYCNRPNAQIGRADRCKTLYGPMVDRELAKVLVQGIEQLKRLLEEGIEDEKQAAKTLGLAAKMAWETAGHLPVDERAHGAPPQKKVRGRKAATPVKGKYKDKSTDDNAKKKQKPKAKSAEESEAETDIEYDKYSALAYDTAHNETRDVRIVVFNKAAVNPQKSRVWVRFLGGFDFSACRISQRVNATGPNPIPFERYCVFTQTWKPETLEPINITERGHYMLYRAAFLTEDDCPGLAKLKATVQGAATFAPDDDGDGDDASNGGDDDVEIVSSSFLLDDDDDDDVQFVSKGRTPASSQSASTSGATSSSSGSFKRKHPEFVEGSSKRPRIGQWLEEERKKYKDFSDDESDDD